MLKNIDYRGVRVIYADQGEGECLLLVHGYLEAHPVWEEFIEKHLQGFRVIAPDLPGHGASGTWGEVHLMDDLAGALQAILEAEGIEKAFMVGHSLGGYVSMAFADRYPENLSGYCLFHSTCFADTEEKKKNRDREISLVKCGKKQQIIAVNILKEFADENLENMKDQVQRSKMIADRTPEEGIVAILNGMKARPDRSDVLKDDRHPVLLIGGMKDNYISAEVFEKLAGLAPHASVLRLQKSGHMGFVEEPGPSAAAIIQMLRS